MVSLAQMDRAFEIETDQSQGVHAFAVRGDLDGATAPRFREALDDAIRGGASSILIDLSECGFLDSTGIGLIVETWRSVSEEANGSLAICCAEPEVQRVLALTGLDRSIEIHQARDKALAALTA